MTSPHRPDLDHDAVCASNGAHRVVVAPPGTGKTYLAVRLAGALAGELPRPPVPDTTVGARVLLLTFSNQARAQLEKEAARQLGRDRRRRVEVSNYHSLFYSAVRAHRRALGLPRRIEIVGRDQRVRALREVDAETVNALNKLPGILDALAEHAVPPFRDERTPQLNVLTPLLAAIETEQQAGRVVFDDLGALFWQLLDRFPVLETAYRDRYPIVIADEHQDASALQDAVIRRLAQHTLVVLADPLQLIHGYRGARDERLDAHRGECGAQGLFELTTPHRWSAAPKAGAWLLAVRQRLLDEFADAPRPAGLTWRTYPAKHGENGILKPTLIAVSQAFAAKHRRVAVLARNNKDVYRLRSYLARNGQFPRANHRSDDFDLARSDIERLHTVGPQEAAHLLVDRLGHLVPGFESKTARQIKTRLREHNVRLPGAGAAARGILERLQVIYENGVHTYFAALVDCLEYCRGHHHVPDGPNLQVLREVAAHTPAAPSVDESAVDPMAVLLDAYADRAANSAATGRTAHDGDGLHVMTVHQAKGKEFDAIVMADASAKAYPDKPDSRRLFYVALTRARTRWTIIVPDRDPSPLLAHL